MLAGVQESEASVTGAGLSVIVTLFVTPLYVALTLTVVWEVTADALAENVAELAPAATVADAGTPKLARLLVRAMAAPPEGAAADRETVHVADAAPVIVVGVHDKALNCGAGGWTVTVVVTLSLPVAVIVTGWLAVTGPAVALKVALVEPAGTVTEAGTVRATLLALKVTANPLAGAALVRLTVQVLNAPEFTVEGEQASADKTAGATRVRLAVFDPPFRVAVSRAVA
ncbi:MAG: hypothetical protein NT090_03940, partial [Acidobacteria bacterium]|nr:hypothetical protein [Acidobacteriota bacterium]